MTSTSLDRTIGEQPGTYLLTRSGLDLRIRPVTLNDGPLLARFFARLSPEDMRFRFLNSRQAPSAAEIGALLRHACDLATIHGLRKLRCVESRSNHDALEVERTLGFNVSATEQEPGLIMLEAEVA